MEALLTLQNGLLRSLALIKYGDDRASKLTDADKKSVEIVATVSKGTTGIDVNGTDIAKHFLDIVGAKMSSTEEVICAVTAIVLFFGYHSLKLVLANRKEIRLKQIEAEDASSERLEEAKKTILLSEEETRRLDIIRKIADQNPKVAFIENEVGKVLDSALKSAASVDRSNIQDIAITGPVAEDLITTPRASSENILINGIYRILSVDGSQDDDFRARLEDSKNRERINATLQDSLLRGQEGEVVQKAFWDKKLVFLKLRARLLRGQIRDAEIVEAVMLQSST